MPAWLDRLTTRAASGETRAIPATTFGNTLKTAVSPNGVSATVPVEYSSPGTPQVPNWDGRSAIENGYYQSVWVQRTLGAIAETIAALPFVAGMDPDNPAVTNPNATLARLLGPATPQAPGGPHNGTSAQAFWQHQIVQKLATGKMVWELQTDKVAKGPTGQAAIVGLWPLISFLVDPVPSNGGDTNWWAGFKYNLPSGTIDLNPDKVFYAWRKSQRDWRQPESLLQSAALPISISVAIERYSWALLKNGLVATHVITSAPLEEPSNRRSFEEQFISNFTGFDQAGKPIFAYADVESGKVTDAFNIQSIAQTSQQAELLTLAAWVKNEILVATGVPESLIGNASQRIYANADSEYRSFWTSRVLNIVAELQDDINQGLAPLLGPEVGWFDLSRVVALQPPTPFMQPQLTDLISAGIMSVAEAQQQLGVSDSGFIDTSDAPIGEESSSTGAGAPGKASAPLPELRGWTWEHRGMNTTTLKNGTWRQLRYQREHIDVRSSGRKLSPGSPPDEAPGVTAQADTRGYDRAEAILAKVVELRTQRELRTPNTAEASSTHVPVGPGELWHDPTIHLPDYIEHVANAFKAKGMPESEAIAQAVGVVRDWAEGKTAHGHVHPDVQAAAAKAIAEWDALKASHNKSKRDEDGDVELRRFDISTEPRDPLTGKWIKGDLNELKRDFKTGQMRPLGDIMLDTYHGQQALEAEKKEQAKARRLAKKARLANPKPMADPSMAEGLPTLEWNKGDPLPGGAVKSHETDIVIDGETVGRVGTYNYGGAGSHGWYADHLGSKHPIVFDTKQEAVEAIERWHAWNPTGGKSTPESIATGYQAIQDYEAGISGKAKVARIKHRASVEAVNALLEPRAVAEFGAGGPGTTFTGNNPDGSGAGLMLPVGDPKPPKPREVEVIGPHRYIPTPRDATVCAKCEKGPLAKVHRDWAGAAKRAEAAREERVGPEGYVHGWIKVGASGLGEKGDPKWSDKKWKLTGVEHDANESVPCQHCGRNLGKVFQIKHPDGDEANVGKTCAAKATGYSNVQKAADQAKRMAEMAARREAKLKQLREEGHGDLLDHLEAQPESVNGYASPATMMLQSLADGTLSPDRAREQLGLSPKPKRSSVVDLEALLGRPVESRHRGPGHAHVHTGHANTPARKRQAMKAAHKQALAGYEQSFTEPLKTLFQKQSTSALVRLNGRRGRVMIKRAVEAMEARATSPQPDPTDPEATPAPTSGVVDPAALFDQAFWLEKTIKALEPGYTATQKGATDTVRAQLGPAITDDAHSLSDARVRAALMARAQQVGAMVNQSTFNQLATSLADGIQAGESISQLAERVKAVFTDASDNRATMLARTEAHSALGVASDGYVSSLPMGIVAGKEWLAVHDSRTRESHRLADGQRQPLGVPFRVGGFPLQFPGDPTGPPGDVINCRCTTAYIPQSQSHLLLLPNPKDFNPNPQVAA